MEAFLSSQSYPVKALPSPSGEALPMATSVHRMTASLACDHVMVPVSPLRSF